MSFQSQDQSYKRLCVGRIATAHGVKGLVKILPFCEDLALLEQVTSFKITLKNTIGKYVLAAIEGVDDRNAAEALKNTDLYIARDQLPEINEDNTFYVEDLVGRTCIDETGRVIGHIKTIENFGAGDLLEVSLSSGQEVLIPFTDFYVPDVAQSVTIRNYEGLIL